MARAPGLEQGEVDAARGALESALRHLRLAERSLVESDANGLAPEALAELRLRVATVRAQARRPAGR